jgi:hypothetical protein
MTPHLVSARRSKAQADRSKLQGMVKRDACHKCALHAWKRQRRRQQQARASNMVACRAQNTHWNMSPQHQRLLEYCGRWEAAHTERDALRAAEGCKRALEATESNAGLSSRPGDTPAQGAHVVGRVVAPAWAGAAFHGEHAYVYGRRSMLGKLRPSMVRPEPCSSTMRPAAAPRVPSHPAAPGPATPSAAAGWGALTGMCR